MVEGCRRHAESLAQPLDMLSCKPSLPSEHRHSLAPSVVGRLPLSMTDPLLPTRRVDNGLAKLSGKAKNW